MATVAEVRDLLEGTSLPIELVEQLLAGASALWLMGEAPGQVAEDLALCHPGLHDGEVRAIARPLSDAGHLVSVVAADRPGLLAGTAGALAAHGLTISSASASAWPDLGLAVQRVVAAPVTPTVPVDWDAVGVALRGAVGAGRPAAVAFAPCPPVAVEAMDQGAGRTLVRVQAPDRVGLLWAIAAWFETHGCNIEVAKVASEVHLDSTLAAVAVDTFVVHGAVDADGLASHLSGQEKPVVPWPVTVTATMARTAADLATFPLRQARRILSR